jgi:hypothetical protein
MAERDIGKGESLQVRVPPVVGTVAGLLVFVIAVAFGFMLLFPNRIGVRFVPHSAFPAPAVMTRERSQRLAIEARQRRALAGGGGRMPIDQAMRQIAQRGDRAFDPVGP